jgi:hypothetical protein
MQCRICRMLHDWEFLDILEMVQGERYLENRYINSSEASRL